MGYYPPSSGGGGGGATTELDNLTTTAVNANVLPDGDGTRNLGALASPWNEFWAYYLRSAYGLQLIPSDGGINIETSGGDPGNTVQVHSGNASGANTSPAVSLSSGSSGSGSTGNVTIETGATSGTRGYIALSALFAFLPKQSADPVSGGLSSGAAYYNTTSNKIKMYNGTAWETVTSV